MTRTRPLTFLTGAVALPLIALVVAGCGGGGNATASKAPTNTAGGRAATVGVASTDLGKILVDSKGRTLYLFKKDAGTRSACSGACATAWPPWLAGGKPTVGRGGGGNPSLVGTTMRSDGASQVTYNDHPLYRYQGDRKPGDTAGQGLMAFGGGWYALSPAGSQVSGKPSSSGGAAEPYGNGGGY